MEIPSSSPIYTPLKPRVRQEIEPMEPITLFPSDPEEVHHEWPPSDKTNSKPVDDATQIAPAMREESVIRSSDDESDTDSDPDATRVDDEFHWSLAQRPPPEVKPENVVENSLLEEEPLVVPGSSSSPPYGEETILSDDEDQYTDSDLTGVGIYDDKSQNKSTQNYLSELLTESLLESLPLPPDRKQHLREVSR